MLTADLFAPRPGAPLESGARWAEMTLLGSVATAVAVIAVAAVGLLMLTGRVDLRRGASVVVGCFVIFGASTIVAGLQAAVRDTSSMSAPVIIAAPALPAPRPDIPASSDPYAGASVPRNR